MLRSRCLLLLGVSLAGVLRGEGVTFSSPRPGQVLAAGEDVEVRIEGVPDDVREFEALLVGGPGRAWVLRVSGGLAPGIRAFRWTVPNLDTSEATLRLRMNRGGREVESAPSATFRIAGSRSEPLARLAPRWGEVWVDPGGDEDDEDDEGPCEPLPVSTMTGTSSSVGSAAPAWLLLLPEKASGRLVAAARSLTRGESVASPALPAARQPLSRSPRTVPARV
ncbi:MAG TPA: hypothetical protein VMN82_04590 [Thermoanaerobaculia bacterium]|nr:hypothetical protein [Thermoanaerobaculia bacterium]